MTILIFGGDRDNRLEKAWEILDKNGFSTDEKSPDLLVISKEPDKKSIGIAQAREVKIFLQEKPFKNTVKAVLVEDAHLMTDEAQNSLLKVLEEPPLYGVIILLSNKEGSLLPTVVSRCQKMYVRSAKDLEKLANYNLFLESHEDLYDLAKNLAEEGKEEALGFLENVLLFDIEEKGFSKDGKGIVLKTEEAIEQIRKSNVALKFALEYIFLLHKEAVC